MHDKHGIVLIQYACAKIKFAVNSYTAFFKFEIRAEKAGIEQFLN